MSMLSNADCQVLLMTVRRPYNIQMVLDSDLPCAAIFIHYLQPRRILGKFEIVDNLGLIKRGFWSDLINLKGSAVVSRDWTKQSAQEVVKTLLETERETYAYQKFPVRYPLASAESDDDCFPFGHVTSRQIFFTLPCCQIYMYPCITH